MTSTQTGLNIQNVFCENPLDVLQVKHVDNRVDGGVEVSDPENYHVDVRRGLEILQCKLRLE